MGGLLLQQFLKMLEAAKTGIDCYPDNVREHQDRFFGLIERCQPFVFSMTNELPSDSFVDACFTTTVKLDAPFGVFSIEILDGNITVPKPEDDFKVTIHCILAYETAPKEYSSYVLATIESPKDYLKRLVVSPMKVDVLLEYYIERINTNAVGQQTIRHTVKIGSGKNKKIHRIRKVIHVRHAKHIETSDPVTRHIDWTHKWLVRGHWRKLTSASLGKDREGNYNVKGYTWVSEHEKGPEDALVVKKVRVVGPEPDA